MARSYELLVWQKAKALAVHSYKATADFPRGEMYGLTSQIRRASVSVVSNIAEGQGRLTSGEFRHFLGQARGSLLEAET
jgi:four helix bundle protein